MLRALLLGLLAVSASACSKSSGESAAKVVPGMAAGKVLEVKGSAQFKRGAETKPLAVGDSVEATDVIITGADGNVVIELAHNSARWELGANKSQKVSESIAWNAKKATAEEVDQATAAAGRPAERNAAGTVATADEGAVEEEKAEKGAPAPPAAEAAMAEAPAPAAAAESDMSPKGGDAPAPAPRPTRRRATAAPKVASPEAESDKKVDTADAEGGGGSHTRGPTRGPTRGATTKGATESMGVASAAPPMAPGGGGAAVGGTTSTASNSKVMARTDPTMGAASAALNTKVGALQKCVTMNNAKDDVTITVTIANGKPTVKLTSKSAVSAELDKCVKGVVNGITFTGSTTISKTIKP